VCPTTEANLGDGFLPVARVLHRDIGLCIGSDSNVRIDPLEELRELEGIARRQTGKRGVMSLDALLAAGTAGGAASLALDAWPDATIDLDHAQLRGADVEAVYDALVFGCSSSVLWKTSVQ
jgi:formimidoylglutamate deiminase